MVGGGQLQPPGPEDWRPLFEAAPGLYLILAPDAPRFTIVGASDAYRRATRTKREQLLGRGVFDAFPDDPANVRRDGAANLRASLERVLASGAPDAMAVQRYDLALPEAEGGGWAVRYWSVVNTPVPNSDGSGVRWLLHGVEDVTEWVRARQAEEGAGWTAADEAGAGNRRFDAEVEAYRTGQCLQAANAALRQSQERLRLIVESATEYAIFTLDREGRVTSWNSGAERILGWAAPEVIGRNAALLFTPEDVAAGALGAEMQAGLAEGRAANERWMLRRDGTRFWASQTLMRLRDHGGPEERGFLKILRDRTERRAAEERLRESEARFRHMADSAPALIWMTDEDGNFIFANMHFDHLFGRPAADFLGDGWKQIILPEDAERFHGVFTEAFRARRPFRAEVRVRDKDGQVRWLRCEGVPRLDDSCRFLGYTGCDVDITEARLAAEELERRVEERTAELMATEATLRQSQKMEAIGQLTGGIAHDFNNMLQAIAGSLEIVQRRIAQGRAAEAGRYLEGARKTVERAAALTHRLLAFARRQALQPRPIEPDKLIEGMAELIRRTVGPGIQVELRSADGIWTVLCDPNQLENVLLNLAINARDAMPDGGTLTIGTEDVRLTTADVTDQEGAAPGDYVEIAVSDTGAGMAPDVLARAFEPFFTTKPTGQGTGLGLSQLYGFVRQSNGVVRLDSAPGRGTTVRLSLPRHERVSARDGTRPNRDDAPPGGAGRTVLLVEDEASVRELAAEALRELGYTVLEAGDARAALRTLATAARLDLLVTDVGLPNGLNGRQMAEIARERHPDLPVLFITGYAGSALEAQLAPGMEVIGKPFALDMLASKVQRLIEIGSGEPAPG